MKTENCETGTYHVVETCHYSIGGRLQAFKLSESLCSSENDLGLNAIESERAANTSFKNSDSFKSDLPIFRKCCPLGSVYKARQCIANESLDLLYEGGLRISFLNEFVATLVVNEHLQLVVGRPCDFMYFEDEGRSFFQKVSVVASRKPKLTILQEIFYSVILECTSSEARSREAVVLSFKKGR
ncbi:hypothetical protein EVAR_18015_1 [Eumeta japonica]|uniref:Uncharacterized protein n=1 Tax=Eumeta variegata TaxID=151549 RepID=A0A4C1ZNK1_EUMVA|nr:hypothetical protein EVAR_18015_1 [Eumeta japonica]